MLEVIPKNSPQRNYPNTNPNPKPKPKPNRNTNSHAYYFREIKLRPFGTVTTSLLHNIPTLQCRRQRRAALVQEAAVVGQQQPPLPFPFDELYNNLVPYPGPSPCVQPPSYVDDPPPYSTLPRPETPRLSIARPSNGDADVSGLFTPDADAAGNACAAASDVSAELTEYGASQDFSGTDTCQNESRLSVVNRLKEIHRSESLPGDERQHEMCSTLCGSPEPNIGLRDDIALVAIEGSNSMLVSSGISTLSAAQTTSIVLWEDHSTEWNQCDGVVSTCDSITHI